MVTEEDSKRERKPQSQPQPRVFKGAEEFESNRLHSVVALGIWLGAIHFNLALLFFSFFLPLSKAFLFVFFSGPSQFFLFIFSMSLFYCCFQIRCILNLIRVFGMLAIFMFIPVDDKSGLGQRLSRSSTVFLALFTALLSFIPLLSLFA